MPRRRQPPSDDEPVLIKLEERSDQGIPLFKPMPHPVWTENKAKLIERYLNYFVYITKGGTYIDGFAGPQRKGEHEMWAAKLVLETQPKWLRHFHLYDTGRDQYKALLELREAQLRCPRKKNEPQRTIDVKRGDFNKEALKLLASNVIPPKEATFCLLDQRTFECWWATVEALAAYRPPPYKIELFYFLATSWFGRSVASLQAREKLMRWWGRDDAEHIATLSYEERKEAFCKRFKEELGYRYVTPWPIYKRQGSGRLMYYMIHASDHEEAPKLMYRAYNKAVWPMKSAEQLDLEFEANQATAEGGDPK